MPSSLSKTIEQGDSSMAKLSGMSGDFKGREFPIDQGEITIGRKADNTILLDHPTISSHHCRILHSGDSCVLQDLIPPTAPGSTPATSRNPPSTTRT
jgi:pSer/pThr/pTyr-binding forkhead associated (FHA) protein